jgi:preprotein translocase subunit SecE
MSIKQKVVTYFDETVVELKKTTWPTKQEIKGSTIVVIITSFLVSIFIFVVDSVLSKLVSTVLG